MKRQNLPPTQCITHLQADVNYTIFHLSDGSKIVSSTTLKKFELVYNKYDFLRINKSYLLNPSFIASVKPVGKILEVLMLNGIQLKTSRRKTHLLESTTQHFNTIL